MDITILEGHAVNPGDLSFDCFKSLGRLTVYERTKDSEAIDHIGDSEAIIINKVHITRPLLDMLPKLRYIGIMATGYNNIDTVAAHEKGIVVANIPSYSTEAVVQHVFALLLEWTNSVGLHNDSVHKGQWEKGEDFCYWNAPLVLLSGKTMGILGLGNIGRNVARVASALGMKVIAYSRTPKEGVEMVGLKELFARSDVISLHAPLNSETKNIVSCETLSGVKSTLIIVNTARGALVDEGAVARALEDGRLGAYLADVASEEPIRSDNPLLKAPHCILTPHIAWAPYETRKKCLEVAYSNLLAFTKGIKQNVV